MTTDAENFRSKESLTSLQSCSHKKLAFDDTTFPILL